MIYVVFIVFAVIVIFIININNTKSKEDANKQYFSESIKSYENFNPTYIKYGLDSEYIFAIDEHAKMLLYHRVNTEPVFLRYEDIIDAELLVEGKVVSKLSSVGIGSAIGSFGVEYGIGAIKDKAKIDALGVNILVVHITMPRLLVVCYSGYTISSSGITAITFNQVLDDANCILDRLKIIVARHQIYQQKELSPEFRSSTVDQILKLVQLKELKVITEEEFQVEKRKVLKNS